MSLHFSANQYEKNFKPTLLQNWEVPRNYREKMIERGMRDTRPRAFVGFTQIVANDRGHLMSGVKRSRESPWGTFIGTWDMPIKIPGNNMTNCTARTENALLRLDRIKTDGDIVLKGRLKQCKVPSPLPVKADRDADQHMSPKQVKQPSPLQTGGRSGARTPLPKSTVDLPASPGINAKPVTPNIDWPRPASRVRSATPGCPASPKSPLPAIVTPVAGPVFPPGVPGSPVGTPKQGLRWPSPKPAENLPA